MSNNIKIIRMSQNKCKITLVNAIDTIIIFKSKETNHKEIGKHKIKK